MYRHHSVSARDTKEAQQPQQPATGRGARATRWVALAAIVLLTTSFSLAFTPKEERDSLDLLVYIDPQLRVVEVTADADGLGEALPTIPEMDAFRQTYGPEWRFTVDLRRGVTGLIDGGAIPFIPGAMNDLPWEQFAPGCRSNDCIPAATAEALARTFIEQNASLLGVQSGELVLDPMGSGPFGDFMYFLRFQWTVGGIPVEHGSVYFRINRGNLLQVASQRVGPIQTDADPTLSQSDARAVVEGYLGPFGGGDDRVLDDGSLLFVPVTPFNQDPDLFDGPIGTGIDYRLAWRFEFQRKDVIGTWEAVVDAHTGELLRFVDTNEYGRVHGGAYPGDNHTGEADRPFAYADTGLPSPNNYADAGGLFPGDNATTTLQGRYARIFDSCGAINNTTTTGDVDFSLGTGTDCAVPTGNTGGPGNTHSARTQYYHLTTANLRAQGWLPGNTWLTSSFITVYTNQSPWCNATSGGGELNFYKASSGCWNLGEIPGVALHEWGHSLDDFDGSGGDSRPVEAYADWMAALHLHDSCVGRGFLLSGNCGGYGDPCTNCTGIRDMDYTQHSGNTPWSAANYNSLWFNSGTSYYGPCGIGAHAEGGIASQALWDFVNRKLTGPPYNLDISSAWLLGDRLWYLVIPTLGYDMYTCSIPNSDGCGPNSLFTVMRAIDDDGDGTANGTPHAAAIFSAMDDHNIACGNAGDPSNQDQTSCPSIGATTLTGVGSNNQAELSWTAATNATRYFIYRNDIGCDAGYTRVGEVDAPTTTFTDTTVVNGIDYYYVIQPVGVDDGCTGPVSNCEIVTPVPCETPAAPTGLVATANGDNRIDLSWSSATGADTYNVYRAVGTCPQASYQLIAGDVVGTGYSDLTASGGLDYAYVVSSKDITGGCESAYSNCSGAQTTGDCLEAPAFDGIQTVTNPGNATCTLDLGWNPATDYCGGPVSYNVYRSETSGFTPGPDSLIASGVATTTFSDSAALDFQIDYFYVVRAVDDSNGSEETNTVELSNTPTGPISTGTWEDDAGDTGVAKLITDPAWSVAATGGNTGPMVYTTGSYGNNLCDGAATPPLQLGTDPQLSFWSRYDIEDNWDKGQVEISTDGGSTWLRVPVNYPDYANRSSDDCGWPVGDYFSGTGSTYAEYTAALDTWSNQEALVRWTLSTDGSVNGSGWLVDDIAITQVDVPSACTPTGSPLPGAFAKSSPADGAIDQGTALSLVWGVSSDATSYEYCIDTVDNDACDGAWVNVGDTTSAALTGLDIGTTYYWQTRAINPYGNTEADGGSWWDFTTEIILPGAFAKVSPANGATGQPTSLSLIWGVSSDTTGYEYCIDTTNNGSCDGSWVNVGNTTGAALSGLADATTYYWQVRAINSLGTTEADGGSWWAFTTLVPLPEAFGKVSPADGVSGQPLDVTLTWQTSTFATGYEYCVDTTDNDTCDASWVSAGGSTSAQPAGMTEMTYYYWQVRAVNSSGSVEADAGTWWELITTPLLFEDGLESGDTSEWTVTVP